VSALLEVDGLALEFRTRSGIVRALERVDLVVRRGEILGVVGESGSGKSATALAVLGLLDKAARVTAGQIRFLNRDLLRLKRSELDEIRGRDAAIIFQNPRAALNPIRSVGAQIADVIARHHPASTAVVRERTLAALRAVRIPDPERRSQAYPFELSGGMYQRIGIAVALSCAPKLLIADEPTTGLDVTTQAVIMDLIRDMASTGKIGVMLITHDLGLAWRYCDRVAVMHAGRVVETAQRAALFAGPRHPYTAGLIASAPSRVSHIDELEPIEGHMPDLRRDDLPPCRVAERCARREPICDETPLPVDTVGPEHLVACRRPL
jgi:peptide/nickel transport system ATP-binding protein